MGLRSFKVPELLAAWAVPGPWAMPQRKAYLCWVPIWFRLRASSGYWVRASLDFVGLLDTAAI